MKSYYPVALIVVCMTMTAFQTGAAHSQDAVKPAEDAPKRNVKFAMKDEPLPVEVERLRQGLRYVAVVRGFASFLQSNPDPRDPQSLACINETPASVRLHAFFKRFGTLGRLEYFSVLDYNNRIIPPAGKHVEFNQTFTIAVNQLRGRKELLPGVFHPAITRAHPPLLECRFFSETADGAKQLSTDFLEVYDHAFLTWLGTLADEKKRELTAARDEAAPKLAELRKTIDI